MVSAVRKQLAGCVFLVVFILMIFESTPEATTFFDDDFEVSTQVGTNNANPVWKWETPYSPVNIYGMMYGSGDVYTLSTTLAHSGSTSLRVDFAGRNGACNTCGSFATLDHKTGMNNTVYFVDNGGADLSAYGQADADHPVYNRTDYWARWTGDSLGNENATNDRLNVTLHTAGMNGSGDSDFDDGDDVILYRQCGVDGNVGGDVDRRSDCDLAINYLEGIEASHHPEGSSIFRRMYFYIPSTATLPDGGFKLGYFHDVNGQAQWTSVLTTPGGRFLELGATGPNFAYTSFGNLSLDTWYYIEEQFQRETSSDANDGEYRMWCSVAGIVPGDAAIEKTTVDLRQINISTGMSIFGNWQHDNDASGYLYIDDVKISSTRIGTTEGYGATPENENRKSATFTPGGPLSITFSGGQLSTTFGN